MTRTARADEFMALPADLEEIRRAAIAGLDAGFITMLDPKRLERVANDPEVRDAMEQYAAATARLASLLGLDVSLDVLLDDLEDV
jgi:hypothetical protein